MDFFYPLPNQGTLANGYGVFQQFVPETREAAAGRPPTRLTRRARTIHVFLRGSYQHRDPNSITFEAGNALTNLPILNTQAQYRRR